MSGSEDQCISCGRLIPRRLVRETERDGRVIVEVVCEECSSTGQIQLQTEFASEDR